MSRHATKPCSGSTASSRRLMERERSGKQTKLAAQISLKGDAIAYSNFLSLLYPMSKINYQL